MENLQGRKVQDQKNCSSSQSNNDLRMVEKFRYDFKKAINNNSVLSTTAISVDSK